MFLTERHRKLNELCKKSDVIFRKFEALLKQDNIEPIQIKIKGNGNGGQNVQGSNLGAAKR